MGVVNDDLQAQAVINDLHPTRHRPQLRDCRQHRGQLCAGEHHGSDRRRQVGQVELPRQRTGKRPPPPGREQVGVDAPGMEARVFDPHIGRGPGAGVGQHLHLPVHRRQHLGREFVIQVDHRMAQARVGEKLQLGPAVGIHTAVVVQVIVGEIGVDRRLELDAIDAPLHQGMGGHLHADGIDALVAPLRQLVLQ